MDEDEFTSGRQDGPLTQLGREDLDPLSIEELEDRISALKAEIERCEQHRDKASSHMKAAEALFGKKG